MSTQLSATLSDVEFVLRLIFRLFLFPTIRYNRRAGDTENKRGDWLFVENNETTIDSRAENYVKTDVGILFFVIK